MIMTLRKFALAAALLLPLSGLPAAQAADALQRSVQLTEDNNRAEQATQQRIEELSDATRRMLEEYHSLSRELDALSVYNDQVERLLQSQEQEQASLDQQLADVELTQRELIPLMLRMIDELGRFVAEDTPFLLSERQQRVALLRGLMDRADVSVAEKYRRILEAYQIETDYGRSIEAYRDELSQAGVTRTVDFVRVGRIGLYYQTLDGAHSGYWDHASRQWVALEGADRLEIRRALRVARKQTAPELLRLQIPAAERDQP
jgi:TolA-binding protein